MVDSNLEAMQLAGKIFKTDPEICDAYVKILANYHNRLDCLKECRNIEIRQRDSGKKPGLMPEGFKNSITALEEVRSDMAAL